jgi:hypothetical protein
MNQIINPEAEDYCEFWITPAGGSAYRLIAEWGLKRQNPNSNI